MPLAPLPPSNTARYFVDYTANGRYHTMMFRYADPSSGPPPETPFIARVAAFIDDLRTWLPTDFEINGARYSVAGSDVTLPTTVPEPVGPFTGVLNAGEAPAFITFVGRSVLGRRWRLSVLGVSVSPAEGGALVKDYRITAGEDVVVSTAIGNLEGWSACVAIDGQAKLVYPYINLGYNAHWQKAVRA